MGTIEKLAGTAAQRIDSFQEIAEVARMTEMKAHFRKAALGPQADFLLSVRRSRRSSVAGWAPMTRAETFEQFHNESRAVRLHVFSTAQA
ncbi:hypothetical protein [Mesorhizobium sp.]|uniref:hypothetical protein n=1 Tax=Mesorhizobium sp. TaxID=1871066 RepID=UPI000FE93B9F|nr:hypothetical protein [Mesorhizobium sp.]RWM28173.1 MAG: hypothetical protein EOR74_10300 [Mesorhizobium sp.]